MKLAIYRGRHNPSIGHSSLVNPSTASLGPLAARGAGLVTGVNRGYKEVKVGRSSIGSISQITILVFTAPPRKPPRRGGKRGGLNNQNGI